MATKSKTKDDGDAPLIDLNEASVKKLIAKAKKKGGGSKANHNQQPV